MITKIIHKVMKIDDTIIIEKLQELVSIHGTQRAAAQHIYNRNTGKPITETYLSMLLHRVQPIPEWLAEVFSYRAEWIYYPLRKEKK